MKRYTFLGVVLMMLGAVIWADCREAEGETPGADAAPSRQAAAPQQGERPAACIPLSLAPVTLPVGILGVPFAHTIQAHGGELPVSLMVTSGSFPSGLNLSLEGVITGTPRASGTFAFTVMATDSCRAGKQAAFRALRLTIADSPAAAEAFQPSVVKKAPLKITVVPAPATFTIVPGKGSEWKVGYRITAQPPQTATLTSPGASFSVAGSVIESVPSPLNVTLVNGLAEVTETITVPARVIQTAIREKETKIVYSRPFSGRETTALAVVEIVVSLPQDSGR